MNAYAPSMMAQSLNNQGDDNTMMIVIAVVVLSMCLSSSSAAVILMRRRSASKPAKALKRRRRRRCFSPDTIIKLHGGESRAMKDLELGDILSNGSVVKATMKINNESDPYYKLPGDILVTGSHYVKDGDTFKQVKDLECAEKTSELSSVVSCIITSDHKIPVGDYIFWDWEDNLISH
jgi:hypothetical protein